MEKELQQLDEAIDWYMNHDTIAPEKLLKINKRIKGTLYRLAKIRDEYHTKYEGVIHSSDESVARATNKAKIEVPELYLLRKVIEAAEGVSMQITQEVSFLKYELNTLNH